MQNWMFYLIPHYLFLAFILIDFLKPKSRWYFSFLEKTCRPAMKIFSGHLNRLPNSYLKSWQISTISLWSNCLIFLQRLLDWNQNNMNGVEKTKELSRNKRWCIALLLELFIQIPADLDLKKQQQQNQLLNVFCKIPQKI